MGENNNREFYPIPSFLEVNGERIRILGISHEGVLLKKDELESAVGSKRSFRAGFVFPYDGYNEVVLSDLNFNCVDRGNGEVLCRFSGLSREQRDFFRVLMRQYDYRRMLSIPSEFMNYTQDEEVRKEILDAHREAEFRESLRKGLPVALAFLVLLLAVFTPAAFKFLFSREDTLTVKVREESQNASLQTREKGEKEEKGQEPEVGKEREEAGASVSPPVPSAEVYSFEDNGSEEEVPPPVILPPPVDLAAVNSRKGRLGGDEYLITGKESSEKEAAEKPAPENSLVPGETYYCVQVASSPTSRPLVRLAEKLSSDYPEVRVEKIGRFYTLRVGFFSDRKEASSLGRRLKKFNPDAFARGCLYKPERWVYPEKG